MNALPTVQFQVNTPCSSERIGENIKHALSLGIPDYRDDFLTCALIANGPSARHAPLKHLAEEYCTVALNGAIRLFTDQGLEPMYWMVCDPQELVADFLPKNPPKETTYIVASKCHPAVFRRLQGRRVMLWHIGDHELTKPLRPVKTASSVTLCALRYLGQKSYGHFEIYGWDGCYEGDLHHASDEPRTEPRDGDIDLVIGAHHNPETNQLEGGRTFHTNTTWALEAQDALQLLHHADYTINIHGDGLIKALIQAPRIA